METKQKSFLLYVDSLAILDHLEDQDVAILFKSMRNYHKGETIKLNGLLFVIWKQFEIQFERDLVKYKARCETNKNNARKINKEKDSKLSESQNSPPGSAYNNNNSNNNSNRNSNRNSEEEEDIIIIKKSKDSLSKEKAFANVFKNQIKNPFSDAFMETWDQWKEYKKASHKFSYKTIDSENIALAHLAKSSNGVEEVAVDMIYNSIAQGYKGIFANNNKQNQNGNKIQLTSKFDQWLNKD